MGYKRDDIVQALIKARLEKGMSTNSMVQYCKQQFGFEQSYSYDLVREARMKIAEIYKEWNIHALEESIADLEEQREIARQAKDRKLYLEISKELNKIKGLYVERQHIEHSGRIEGLDIRIITKDDTTDDSSI